MNQTLYDLATTTFLNFTFHIEFTTYVMIWMTPSHDADYDLYAFPPYGDLPGRGVKEGVGRQLPAGTYDFSVQYYDGSGTFNLSLTGQEVFGVHNIDTGVDYRAIQEAIDAPETVEGNTILADNGTYNENVILNKSVSLVGENMETTIIDGRGTGNTLEIVADHVNVTNFTIRNSGGAGYSFSGVYLDRVENCSIIGNSITANEGYGVWIEQSSSNSIFENRIENNGGGLLLMSSNDNTIARNNFTDSGGLLIDYSSDNVLAGNAMTGNTSFGLKGADYPDFINNVDASNTVNGKSILYLVDQQNVTVSPQTFQNVGYLAVVNSTYVTIQNLNIEDNFQGVLLAYTNDSLIQNVTVAGNGIGIELDHSHNNQIIRSNMRDNGEGIALHSCSTNAISQNNISASDMYGVWLYTSSSNVVNGNNVESNHRSSGLWGSSHNMFFHNNFLGSFQMEPVLNFSYDNVWHNGYPSGGNYWSKYAGADMLFGFNQNEAGSDEIGDTPYVIDAYDQDRYPLMSPWVEFENQTIYIRADGTIDPSGAPIRRMGDIYILTDNVTSDDNGIVIEKDNIVVDGAGHTLEGRDIWTEFGIVLSERSNVTIKIMQIKAFWGGIGLLSSSNNTLTGNRVTNCRYGICLQDSSNHNNLIGNIISNINGQGILIHGSQNNKILGNNITDNTYEGIWISGSSNYSSISGNIIAKNKYGIMILSSSNWSVSSNIIEYNQIDGLILQGASNMLIENNTISNNNQCGITAQESSQNITIRHNMITDNGWHGIFFIASNTSTIHGNIIARNELAGIHFLSSSNSNIIFENSVSDNKEGMSIVISGHNKVYHNNFINNTLQVGISQSFGNKWDDDYPSGGNYWSGYGGSDIYSGIYRNETGYDWIGDAPYVIDSNNADMYPLMHPFDLQTDDIEIAYRNLLVEYNGLRSDFESLNSTYYDLLNDYTVLSNKVDQLTEDYNALNSSYNSLDVSFTDYQQTTQNELANIKNILYVFIAITVILAAALAYVAARKPKTKT
jgi:parallel beta-helix repeat protein